MQLGNLIKIFFFNDLLHDSSVCVSSIHVLTRRSCHSGLKEERFPPNDLPRCDFECGCFGLLFRRSYNFTNFIFSAGSSQPNPPGNELRNFFSMIFVVFFYYFQCFMRTRSNIWKCDDEIVLFFKAQG